MRSAVGFSSLGAFSTQFSRLVGVHPRLLHPAMAPWPLATGEERDFEEDPAASRPYNEGSIGGTFMIKGLSIVSVWVLDPDEAKAFYTEKLGFELTGDFELENGMRWLTVRPPGNPAQELLLMDPMRSMLDAKTAETIRSLVAQGALSPGVMATDDCEGDFALLSQRGVSFVAEPASRPYGVEAVMRDDSGNWYSFTQRKI